MYFAIEAAALALMVCCTVQLWRLSRRLIDERDMAIEDRDSMCRDLVDQMKISENWKRQAEAFEAAGKQHEETIESLMDAVHTMEEHIAAERARADKLAAALQEAEDKAEKLMQEAKEARERAARLMQELADLRAAQGGVTAEAVRAAIAPGNPMDTFAREMSNIFAYNGTSEGQEELTNG